jgi:hypothetical protein
MKASFALALASAILTSCSEAKIACPQILSPGVAVAVHDAATGALTASGAKLVAQAGSYADSMSFPVAPAAYDAAHLTGAYRAGVYTLTVTKAGFQPWVQSNITITAARCGVNLVELDALLQRAQ